MKYVYEFSEAEVAELLTLLAKERKARGTKNFTGDFRSLFEKVFTEGPVEVADIEPEEVAA